MHVSSFVFIIFVAVIIDRSTWEYVWTSGAISIILNCLLEFKRLIIFY